MIQTVASRRRASTSAASIPAMSMILAPRMPFASTPTTRPIAAAPMASKATDLLAASQVSTSFPDLRNGTSVVVLC